MRGSKSTRRQFLRTNLAAGTAAGIAASGLTAAEAGRVIGAAETIRVGMIGCGGRNTYLARWLKNVSEQGKATIVAACDIWRQRREAMVPNLRDLFGKEPKLFADYRALLEDKGIDAVIIATPDHQHCGQLTDAVRAGKDAYVEKPIARSIDELNRAYDAVKETKAVVQHGTQGRSAPGKAAAKAFFESNALGKLIRVESCETAYIPYWNFYAKPEKESDTDWKAFLYGRPDRPFDPDQHGSWMGYYDFASGPIGGWMSHFIDFVHGVTGCGFPRHAVSQGGIYSPTSDRRRTAPDNVTCLLEYPEGFVTQFVTHFGSNLSNEWTLYYFEKGTMRTSFGHAPGAPVIAGDGSEHPERPKEPRTLETPTTQDHMLNWLECIRAGRQPAADMDAGYKQGVAVLMAEVAYETGRKTMFDPAKRELRPA